MNLSGTDTGTGSSTGLGLGRRQEEETTAPRKGKRIVCEALARKEPSISHAGNKPWHKTLQSNDADATTTRDTSDAVDATSAASGGGGSKVMERSESRHRAHTHARTQKQISETNSEHENKQIAEAAPTGRYGHIK
mmetsp:Transcript_9208/g.23476  ORF Transcript_9208/g.23476 Transcript_9208/m.23476 type:complete len:136 (-) Transcript_9208:222-629(-)